MKAIPFKTPILGVALFIGLAASAFAVDGVVLIDQNNNPSFPIVLGAPGSYRLASNLNVPANADGIVIGADHITLDLNGFVINGNSRGYGYGINNKMGYSGIVIRNGGINSINTGVELGNANNVTVEQLDIRHCNFGIDGGVYVTIIRNTVADADGIGIIVNGNSIISGNIVFATHIYGIWGGGDSIVSGNIVSEVSPIPDGSVSAGIVALEGSTVTGNTVSHNTGQGISVNCPTTLIGNAARANQGGDIRTSNSTCTFANNIPPP